MPSSWLVPQRRTHRPARNVPRSCATLPATSIRTGTPSRAGGWASTATGDLTATAVHRRAGRRVGGRHRLARVERRPAVAHRKPVALLGHSHVHGAGLRASAVAMAVAAL